MRQGQIAVLLMDDHVVVREGLRALLERQDDIDVMAEASTVAEAVALDVDPDVVVADLMLPDERGVEVVRRLKERHQKAAILVLTMVDNPTDVQQCLAAGARGYLLKETAGSELVDAVRKVAGGEDYLQPSLGAALAKWKESPGKVHARAVDDLTPREREVLRLIALGHTNSEIATMLYVSVRTVENHRAGVMRKLGLRTRAELVRHAAEAGLI
ncbi:MAG: response regulator transcription factor [Actinomycetota bacterium]